MAITKAEFDTARRMVQEAIIRNGDLRTALLTINRLEADAIRKSMQIIADYFVQTRQQAQQQEQKTK